MDAVVGTIIFNLIIHSPEGAAQSLCTDTDDEIIIPPFAYILVLLCRAADIYTDVVNVLASRKQTASTVGAQL